MRGALTSPLPIILGENTTNLVKGYHNGLDLAIAVKEYC
ncbi:hypothetical protein CULT_1600013 [[Clostridium] ultunense Esp]|nr:hypothetical protein CULT_1600013 [[Clostridium] ultunense Esp]